MKRTTIMRLPKLIEKYLAIKRDGAVISASDYLTWSEASAALDNLRENYAESLNETFFALVRERFPDDGQRMPSPRSDMFQASDPSQGRGLVFRSHNIPIEYALGGDRVFAFVSFSITICVKVAGDAPGMSSDVSRSKIWQTAAVESDTPLIGNEAFMTLASELESFFKTIREPLLMIYERCLKDANPAIVLDKAIGSDDPEFNYLTFQQPDKGFRKDLADIVGARKRISDFRDDKHSVMAVLEAAFQQGPGFLHFNRDTSRDVVNGVEKGINTTIFNDRYGSKGLFVYSWINRVKTRFVGVTAADEPVSTSSSDPHSDHAHRLSHTPASILSAGLVAELAQRY